MYCVRPVYVWIMYCIMNLSQRSTLFGQEGMNLMAQLQKQTKIHGTIQYKKTLQYTLRYIKSQKMLSNENNQ